MSTSLFAGVEWLPVVAFLAAVLLIDSFDISLPRGDSIGMAGALIAAAVVTLGPLTALAIAVASTVATQTVKGLKHEEAAPSEEVAIRLVATSTAVTASLALATDAAPVLSVLLVPTAYLGAELLVRQGFVARHGTRTFKGLVLGNLSRQWLLFAAQLSVSALTVLTFESMGAWSVLPVAALLLLMRQAYSVLLEIRETYLTTVSVLVEAAESQRPELAGHAERTAAIAREIASRCGMAASEIERLSYAALLHDIGRIGESAIDGSSPGSSYSLVEHVSFFENVLPVLRELDPAVPHQPAPEDRHLLAAFIVALSSDIDTLANAPLSAEDRAITHIVPHVARRSKAQVVSAALALGFPVPAID